MKHLSIKFALCCIAIFIFSVDTFAQMPGPGAKRDADRIKELEKGSVLVNDTIVVIDTVIVFDPETFEETMTIVESKFSLFDYYQQVLGVSDPNELLDGKERTISNPVTYEPMKIRWNAAAGKVDTIQ